MNYNNQFYLLPIMNGVELEKIDLEFQSEVGWLCFENKRVCIFSSTQTENSQIKFEKKNGGIYVTDVCSENGVYFGKEKLKVGVERKIMNKAMLRLNSDDVWFEFNDANADDSEEEFSGSATSCQAKDNFDSLKKEKDENVPLKNDLTTYFCKNENEIKSNKGTDECRNSNYTNFDQFNEKLNPNQSEKSKKQITEKEFIHQISQKESKKSQFEVYKELLNENKKPNQIEDQDHYQNCEDTLDEIDIEIVKRLPNLTKIQITKIAEYDLVFSSYKKAKQKLEDSLKVSLDEQFEDEEYKTKKSKQTYQLKEKVERLGVEIENLEEEIRQTLMFGEVQNHQTSSDGINRHWEENTGFIDVAEVNQKYYPDDSGGLSALEVLKSKVRALIDLEKEVVELSKVENEIEFGERDSIERRKAKKWQIRVARRCSLADR